jgi:hypothetical protein
MIRELMKLPRVQKIQFDLENWIISNEPGALNIVKKKGLGQHPTSKYQRQ